MAKYKGKFNDKKEFDELEESYQKISPAKKKSKKKDESSKRRGWIIGICITILTLAIAILAVTIYYNNFDNTPILENVYVAGVHVGGMTKAEAEKAVYEATKDTFGKTTMVVTVLDRTIEIPGSAVESFNIKGAVRAACNFGNLGFPSTKEKQREVAATTGYIVDLTPYLSVDKNLIKAKLGELGSIEGNTFKESTYEVVGETPTAEQVQNNEGMQKIVVQVGVPEYGVDVDTLYKAVLSAYSKNIFSVNETCATTEPAPIDFQSILDAYYLEPVDATYKNGTKEIIPGVYGYGFDVEEALKIVENADYGSTVEIPFTQIEPTVTADNINEVMFPDQLSTWTATQASSANRQNNLRLACEALNGIVLFPGDTLSYNETLGERTTERGYKAGASYSGGETVLTIGGGICQVSSTLYYAVMHADLEIVTRENHGFVSSYVPYGMDATVSWNAVDFVFKNNSEHPIRIVAEADGNSTTVSIYSIDDKDYEVKIEYEIVSVIGSKETYKELPPDNPDGYKDGDYIVTPYTGYKVVTYRCKYDKDSGELISREKEATSIYNARDAVICKIVEPPAPTEPTTPEA